MKILSLETKKHLVGWSVGLGVLINYLLGLGATLGVYNCSLGEDCSGLLDRVDKGIFPLGDAKLSLIFWILVVFIIKGATLPLGRGREVVSS